jgi:hypothetical protein
MKDGIKIFGFRSGKAYKMVPAILYYVLIIYVLVGSVVGELMNYKFEKIDYILMLNKYIFFGILFLSPLIFLSDFKYRDKLPFFKKHNTGSSLIGIILVWMFCYLMAQVNIMCMSPTWVKARDAYIEKMEKEQKEQLEKQLADEAQNNESATQAADETVETQINSESNKKISYNDKYGINSKVSYDFSSNIVYIAEV